MKLKFCFLLSILGLLLADLTVVGNAKPGTAGNVNPQVFAEALKAQPIRWGNSTNVNTEYTEYW
ncbi:MAG: hypothetical protein ACOCVA_08340, partial [Prolixibacteraceae bacterium]